MSKYIILDFNDGLDYVADLIDEMPSADVVEVVRCKDCRHYIKPYCSRFMVGLTPADDDAFCAWGERKDG